GCTPRRETMHQLNKRNLLQVPVILLLAAVMGAQTTSQAGPGNASPANPTTTTPAAMAPATGAQTTAPAGQQPANTQQQPAQPAATAPDQGGQAAPADNSGAPSTEENGTFVFRKSVSE